MKKNTTSTQLIVGKNIAYFQHRRQELKNEASCDLQNYQDYHTKHNRPLTAQEISQRQTQIKDFLDAYDKALEIYEKLNLNAIRSYVPLTKTGFLPKKKKQKHLCLGQQCKIPIPGTILRNIHIADCLIPHSG